MHKMFSLYIKCTFVIKFLPVCLEDYILWHKNINIVSLFYIGRIKYRKTDLLGGVLFVVKPS